jgi:hypothetical protein
MIIKTDKNLGPAIIDRKQYVLRAFQDHLCNEDTYQQLHPSAAQPHVKNLNKKSTHLLSCTSLKPHHSSELFQNLSPTKFQKHSQMILLCLSIIYNLRTTPH